MNIVALGNAACKIAECFRQYPIYDIFRIDVGLITNERDFGLDFQKNAAEYEEKCESPDYFFRNMKGDEVIFIMAGSSPVSGCALKILESLKQKKITILYIQPDETLLNETGAKQNRLTLQVFQQYARSGLFEKIYIVNNTTVADIIGDIPITQYYEKINEMISSTFHFINVYKHIKPLMENQPEILEIARIGTFGIHDIDTKEDKFFYPLQFKTNQTYFFAYNKKTLDSDGKIFNNVKERLRERTGENTKVAFGIYATDYPENFVFCEAQTHFIQEERF